MLCTQARLPHWRVSFYNYDMALFSLFEKHENEIALVFSIGSRSVGGGIVRLTPNGKPKIFYTVRYPIPFQKNLNPIRLRELMRETLSKVCIALQKEGLTHLTFTEFKRHKIKNVYLAFSSPWYISETKILRIQKPEPFFFDHTTVNEALGREEKDFEKSELAAAYRAAGNEVIPLDQKVVQIRLNGYETSSPYGKKITEAEIALFVSLIEKSLLSDVEDVIQHTFHYHKALPYSFSLIAYSVMRDIFPNEEDFLSIHIHGEITEVSVVRKGILLESLSFPLGRNFFVRKACRILGSSPEICISTLILHFQKKTAESNAKVKETIEEASAEWRSELAKAFEKLSTNMYLPGTAYLTAEKDFTDFFAHVIASNEFTSFTSKESPLAVRVLSEENLESSCDFSDKTVRDSFITMESIFFNKLYELQKSNVVTKN